MFGIVLPHPLCGPNSWLKRSTIIYPMLCRVSVYCSQDCLIQHKFLCKVFYHVLVRYLRKFFIPLSHRLKLLGSFDNNTSIYFGSYLTNRFGISYRHCSYNFSGLFSSTPFDCHLKCRPVAIPSSTMITVLSRTISGFYLFDREAFFLDHPTQHIFPDLHRLLVNARSLDKFPVDKRHSIGRKRS